MSASVSSSILPRPTPQRPIGVVLAAIALSLLTCLGLFCGCMEFVAAVFIRTTHVGQVEHLPPAVTAIEFALGILITLISGVCAWTVVDLFRMKRWARISIVIVGGVLAVISAFDFAAFCVFAFGNFMPPATAGKPVSPLIFKAVFLGLAGIAFLFTLTGVWWLVYFNLRRVRMIFAACDAASASPELAGGAPSVEERPVPIGEGANVLGILVNCLGVLYLFGAVSMIVCAFIGLPLLLMAHLFGGTGASFIYLLLAAVNIGIGIGLLRRLKPAWIAALALNVFGAIAELMMLSPGSRALMEAYRQDLLSRMGAQALAATPDPLIGAMITIGAMAGVLIMLGVIWLLFRAKPLFEAGA